jgi:hypothetical protein
LRSAWSLKESRVLVRFDAGCEDGVFLSALEVASRASGAAVVGGFGVGIVELIAVVDAVIGLVPSRSNSDRLPVTRVPPPLGRTDSLAAREGSTGPRIRRTTKAMEMKAPISAAMAKCTNFGTDGCAGNFPSPRSPSVADGPRRADRGGARRDARVTPGFRQLGRRSRWAGRLAPDHCGQPDPRLPRHQARRRGILLLDDPGYFPASDGGASARGSQSSTVVPSPTLLRIRIAPLD